MKDDRNCRESPLRYRIRNRTSRLKMHDVEQVAWMLTVQRRAELAGIEIGRIEALDLDEQLIGLLRGRAQFA